MHVSHLFQVGKGEEGAQPGPKGPGGPEAIIPLGTGIPEMGLPFEKAPLALFAPPPQATVEFVLD